MVVVHAASKILLIKRGDCENFWQSVIGSLEWGEIPSQAAKRELAEEVGIIDTALSNTGVSRSYQILQQ